MTTLDRIRKLCEDKGVKISRVERDLGFANGSLLKSENISASRLYSVAKYFRVPLESLLSDEEVRSTNRRIQVLEEKNKLLERMCRTQNQIMEFRSRIAALEDELNSLQNQIKILDNTELTEE